MTRISVAFPCGVKLNQYLRIVSVNYVINEYLDAGFDKYHPLKKARIAVVRTVQPYLVFLFYGFLAVSGLMLGAFVSTNFLFAAGFLLFMGLVYNVEF